MSAGTTVMDVGRGRKAAGIGKMIRYICDLCRRELQAEEDLRYVVKIEVYAAFDPAARLKAATRTAIIWKKSKTCSSASRSRRPTRSATTCTSSCGSICAPSAARNSSKNPLGRKRQRPSALAQLMKSRLVQRGQMKGTIFDLTGRSALVTGGSKGLGQAMGQIFAQAGAEVMIASRHVEELRATAESDRIEPPREGVESAVADMTRRAHVLHLAETAQVDARQSRYPRQQF